MKGIKVGKGNTIISLIANVILHLNIKTGKRFNPKSKGNIELLSYWINKGFQEFHFKRVIDFKAYQWLHIPMMKSSLKPNTLFAAHNFRIYLQEAEVFFDKKQTHD